jgi:hypothetical protein
MSHLPLKVAPLPLNVALLPLNVALLPLNVSKYFDVEGRNENFKYSHNFLYL